MTKAILPTKPLDVDGMRRALENALTMSAKAVQVDFGVTVQTWDHGVTFAIEQPAPLARTVATDDSIYGMLNAGTKAHRILPRNGGTLRFNSPFKAKTSPRSISSGPGARGSNEVWARGVDHPGTTAREWDQVIAEKWKKLLPTQLQRAIDAEVSR